VSVEDHIYLISAHICNKTLDKHLHCKYIIITYSVSNNGDKVMSNIYTIHVRKDIIEKLIKAKIELGLNPEMVFKHYANEGLIPKAKSKGMGQGKGRQAVYPEYVFDMVKKIRKLQKSGKKIAEIKEIITKKYKWVFHLEDIEKLKTLRFPDQQIIDNYCELWGINENGRKKVQRKPD
jgi:DNA-binding transcriptional MerR regulator